MNRLSLAAFSLIVEAARLRESEQSIADVYGMVLDGDKRKDEPMEIRRYDAPAPRIVREDLAPSGRENVIWTGRPRPRNR